MYPILTILGIGIAFNVIMWVIMVGIEEYNDYQSIKRARTKDLKEDDYIQEDNLFDKLDCFHTIFKQRLRRWRK